jgi:hypothetical protein
MKKRVGGYVVKIVAVIPLKGGDPKAWENAVKTVANAKNALEEAGALFHTEDEAFGEVQVEAPDEKKGQD